MSFSKIASRSAKLLKESVEMMPGGVPMDPAMMGGAPPMDPAMMGGAPPMDPAMMGGAPPMDPAMMGGMPPMQPPSEEQMATDDIMQGIVDGSGPEADTHPVTKGEVKDIVGEILASEGEQGIGGDVDKRLTSIEQTLSALAKRLGVSQQSPSDEVGLDTILSDEALKLKDETGFNNEI